jgi:hypothetical protein
MKVFGGLVSSLVLAGLLAAQPSLRITSPADGTIVHPAESLTMTIDVSTPDALRFVMVVGFSPIGASGEAPNAPPYRFTVDIPKDIKPDEYVLSAVGVSSGGPVNSNPLTSVVERADSP